MSDRPNVVLILTDQQRADLTAREGYPLDTTPFLDQLATDGVWFNRAYTPVPVCLAARISLLTGRFPSATRIRCNQQHDPPLYEHDLVDIFHHLGYRTGLCGKNHSHLRPGRLDFCRGYGHWGGPAEGRSEAQTTYDQWLRSLVYDLEREPTPHPLEQQLPSRIVDDALGWLAEPSAQPFFLWLSIPEPHNPYQVPEPYYSLFPPNELPPLDSRPTEYLERGFAWEAVGRLGRRGLTDYDQQLDRARSNYHGMLRLIDDQLRRFVAGLEQLGLRDDTLLVFCSDHGDFVGEYGLLRKGPELPECLMRVPLSWAGPGIRAQAEPHEAHVSLVDILPTLCEAVDAPVPAGVQGRSLWPLLTGGHYPAEEFASVYGEQGFGGLPFRSEDNGIEPDEGFDEGRNFDCLNTRTQSGALRMVRQGDWKLALDVLGHGQLYHLASDPREQRNRFGQPEVAEIQAELTQALAMWLIRVQDPLPICNRRYVTKTDSRGWVTPYTPTGNPALRQQIYHHPREAEPKA